MPRLLNGVACACCAVLVKRSCACGLFACRGSQALLRCVLHDTLPSAAACVPGLLAVGRYNRAHPAATMQARILSTIRAASGRRAASSVSLPSASSAAVPAAGASSSSSSSSSSIGAPIPGPAAAKAGYTFPIPPPTVGGPGGPSAVTDHFNPGMDLDLGWVQRSVVNKSATERRAAEIGPRRAVKKKHQVAWLLRAISMIDLTTLAGDDTPGNVQRLCAKVRSVAVVVVLWWWCCGGGGAAAAAAAAAAAVVVVVVMVLWWCCCCVVVAMADADVCDGRRATLCGVTSWNSLALATWA